MRRRTFLLAVEHRCPSCGRLLDAATSFDHVNAPKPGDFTVCVYCGVLLRFTADGLEPTTSEAVLEQCDRGAAEVLIRFREQLLRQTN
jgi:hypothetical protein